MKKNELKTILKPLIKECIKECIFEEGVLSGIITEVAKGMSNQRVVVEGLTVESKTNTPDQKETQKRAEELEAQRQERIRKLNEALPFDNTNIFEGTQAIPAQPTPGSAMAGVAPNDPGVDIGGLMSIAQNKWKQLL